jgi:hypothetical protein
MGPILPFKNHNANKRVGPHVELPGCKPQSHPFVLVSGNTCPACSHLGISDVCGFHFLWLSAKKLLIIIIIFWKL